MNGKCTMNYSDGQGNYVKLDLCCFCRKLKSFMQSGDCEYYENGCQDTVCPGFVQVESVSERITDIIRCRC